MKHLYSSLWGSAAVFTAVLSSSGCSGAAPSASGSVGSVQSKVIVPVEIQLLAFNDFHGALTPPSGTHGLVSAMSDDPIVPPDAKSSEFSGLSLIEAGGAAYFATHIKRLRAENPNTVVVSAGDLTGGSPFVSNIFDDEPTIRVMNAVGLDFEGVGNHDFERGVPKLLQMQFGYSPSVADKSSRFEGANFQYLAANVNVRAQQTLFPSFAVKQFNGVKIAFIGLTLQGTASVISPALVRDLEFGDEVETVNALIPHLRSRGVDAVVVLLHQGWSPPKSSPYNACDAISEDIRTMFAPSPQTGRAKLDPSVDVVVSGHTHQAYNCLVDGRLVTSAASNGRLITKIDLTIDPVAGRVTNKTARNVVVTRDVQPDSDVQGIIAQYEAISSEQANQVVGSIAGDLHGRVGAPSCETELGDLIADAQLTRAGSSAQIAFTNTHGIRADVPMEAPGKKRGAVLYSELFAVQPFDNELVSMTLTGAQIREALRQQFSAKGAYILQVSRGFSFSYTWSAIDKKGTVDDTSVMLNGAPLADTAAYRVVVNSFLAAGGDGFSVFTEGTDPLVSVTDDLTALVDHVASISSDASPIVPRVDTRIVGNACL